MAGPDLRPAFKKLVVLAAIVLLSAISRDLISDTDRIPLVTVQCHGVTIRYFAGPDLRRAGTGAARVEREQLLSAISRDLISDCVGRHRGASSGMGYYPLFRGT